MYIYIYIYIYTTGRCTCVPLRVRGDPYPSLYISHIEDEKTRRKLVAEGMCNQHIRAC
jgi:hypothetical protein